MAENCTYCGNELDPLEDGLVEKPSYSNTAMPLRPDTTPPEYEVVYESCRERDI